MANEKLNFNTYDGGWTSGAIGDVDEAIASADGAAIAATVKNDVALMGLDASVVVDGDTVNTVDVIVRARTTGAGDDALGVELLIGGVVQGARQDSVSLTGSFVNYSFSDAVWDADWTEVQMDGMEIRLHARQSGMPTTAGHEVDCGDIDVDYTPVAGGEISQLPKVNLTLTTFVPQFITTENNISVLATVALSLATFVPTFETFDPNTSQLPKVNLTLATFVPQIVTTEGDNNVSNLSKVNLILARFVPQFETTENHISNLPKVDLTLATFVPQFETFDPNTSQLPKVDLTLNTFVPQFVTTEGVNNISQLPSTTLLLGTFVPQFITIDNNISNLPKVDLTLIGFPPQFISVPPAPRRVVIIT